MAGTIGTAYIQIAPNMSGVQGKIASGLQGSGSAFADHFNAEVSGKSAAMIGVISGVAAAATQKAMALVGQQFSAAIDRFDTIQNFPKVMQNFGIQTTDASAAMKILVKGVAALPTSLNDIVSLTEAFTPFSKNVGDASKLALALNDALLAGGTPMYVQSAAMEQFRQALAKGMPQLQDWRSLETAMPAQLQQVAKALGLGSGALAKYGTNGQGLYNAMSDGKVSLQDFNNTLLQLDKQGLGTLPSFQVQAKNASNGVATSFQVLKQRIQQAMVDIFTLIGQQNISNAINNVGKAFTVVGKAIIDILKFMVKYKDIFGPIAVGVTTVVGAMTAWWAITKSISIATAIFNALLAASPVGLVTLAIAGLVTGLIYFFTKTETGKRVFADIMTFAGQVFNSIKGFIKNAADFLSGAWSGASGAVSAAFTAIKDTAKAVFDAVAGFIAQHIKAIENIAIIITTIFLPSIARVAAGWAVTAAQAVASFAVMAAGAVVNAATTTAAWVVSAAKSVAAFVVALPSMIAQFALASAAAVVNAAKSTAAWVVAAAQTAASWAVTIAGYIAAVAVAAAQTLLAGARMAAAWLLALGPIGLIVAVAIGAGALIVNNWSAVSGFFISVWNGIKNAVSAVFGWITANWPLLLAIITGPIGLAVLFVSRSFSSIAGFAANAINMVAGFFGGLPGRILGAVGNLGGILYNAGRSMIQGLLNGAGSLLSSIGSFFLSKLPGWIVGPFKSALGIHSPSTVFAGMGANISQGLANGILAGKGDVLGAMGSITDAALSPVMGGVSPSAFLASPNAMLNGASAGDTTTQTVTIGSVHLGDQSAVQEFFKQLDQDVLNGSMGLTPNQGAM